MLETHTNYLTFQDMVFGNALDAAIAKKREDVVEEVYSSGLRGRGGAGFLAGLKLRLCANENPGGEHVIICNADEGEPGTFKDRMLLSDFPKLVFEGMAIASYAVGAKKAYMYLRDEYHYLLDYLENVLEEMKTLLDKVSLTIEIRLGAGAYICGEETALIESMEGMRGEPRDRPPYPVTDGYLHKPTAVLNVETLAWIPAIILNGSKWFGEFGTEKSAGLKLFSVSGDCEHPGVYEFPMGVTIAEILKEAGGENAKAVQVGGAAGECVPAADFSRRLCFEDVPPGGSIIVFSDKHDMLEIVENFLEFFVDESCGQCTPCREGNGKLLEGVELLKKGKCSTAHLEELIRLGQSMKLASKCGLGQTSPNAFLSICEHFRSEIMNRMPS